MAYTYTQSEIYLFLPFALCTREQTQMLVHDSTTQGDKFMKGRETNNEKTHFLRQLIICIRHYLYTRENDRQRIKQIFFNKNNNIQKYKQGISV